MKLQTEVALKPLKHQLSLSDSALAMGSCFASHLGGKLGEYKFDIQVNPGGVLFNPVSLARVLKWAAGQEEWDKQMVVENEGVWSHFHLHSQLSGRSEAELDENMARLRAHFSQNLNRFTHVFITLGTAWVYEHLESCEIVANCHRIPAERFKKRLLSVQEAVKAVLSMRECLPRAKFVLTVSPVRHLKDTLPLNAVSKSVLRLACHELAEQYDMAYFPAYEIMVDELRDYRFYKSDMLHPNEQGIDYVWERFMGCGLSANARLWISKWEGIRRDLAHRPRFEGGPAHLKFLSRLRDRLLEVTEVDVSEELLRVEGLLDGGYWA